MQIPVLIERVVGNGFRASGAFPFAFTVEGTTRDEVVQKTQQLITSKLKTGSELVQVNVPVEEDNPWLKMAGMWDKDDPLVQEWKEIMRENRLKDE